MPPVHLAPAALRKAIPLLLAFCAMPLLAAGGLEWRAKENRVSAEIAGSKVVRVLEQIAEATGWQIYIEPGTEHTVSTKFKDRTVGEALQLLLGRLSYVRVPGETNGPARLYVFRTTRNEATQLVSAIARKDPTARPIPNELVMRLKPECTVEEVAKTLQAKVLGRATVADTYRLSFETPEAAQAARKQAQEMTCVEAIDYNYWMHRPEMADSLSLPGGSSFDLKPRSSEDCATRIVGLIDTAIQPTGTSLDQFLLPGISVAGQAQLSGDVPAHATSMLGSMLNGIAQGLNSSGEESRQPMNPSVFTLPMLAGPAVGGQNETSVKVLPVDVYGPNASTTTFDVANGIIQAVNKGATVINLSLGSAGDSDFLRDVVRRGAERGVLFLAAAGNEPTTTPTYPAAYPHVMAVTAGGRDGKIAPYANRGEFIDISAPGSGMFPYNGQNWMVMGTSAATAYASGVAASLWDCNKATAGQVSASMLQLMPVKR